MAYGDELIGSEVPQVSAITSEPSRKFLLDNSHYITRGVTIEKDTDDEDNTGKVNKLRGGLVLLRVEAGGNTGKFVDVGHPDAPDNASVKQAVILLNNVNMFDRDGATRVDKQQHGVVHGRVEESKLLWYGADATRKDAIKAVMNGVIFESVP